MFENFLGGSAESKMSSQEQDILDRANEQKSEMEEFVGDNVPVTTAEDWHGKFPILKEMDEHYKSAEATEEFKKKAEKFRKSMASYHKLLWKDHL